MDRQYVNLMLKEQTKLMDERENIKLKAIELYNSSTHIVGALKELLIHIGD